MASGYLFSSHMLVRLAVLGGAVGLAMTVAGAVLLSRFLHSSAHI